MRVLELFSGTKSVGKICDKLGWPAVSVDLHHADINIDILVWDYKTAFPVGHFDVIWASFPCQTFSIIKRSNLGMQKSGGGVWTRADIEHDIITRGLPLLHKSLEIIEWLKPRYFFLENPATGRAKEFISLPNFTVDYCQYAPEWGYRKRTMIWTNISGFVPRLCHSGCAAKIYNPATHRTRHRRATDSGNAKNGTRGTTQQERYRIPPKLIEELFQCVKD